MTSWLGGAAGCLRWGSRPSHPPCCPCIQVSNLKILHTGVFLPPGAFLPELELLNINKDYQLVEEGEGGEEAQLWGEAILGAAILPQLQEADSGRYLNPYIYILV